MGFLVALLLNYMPEEDAFYFLITLLENYNLKNLYKPNLPLLAKYFYQLHELI